MKVLVTGATGFLGYHTTQFLLEKGYEVVGIGRENEEKLIKLGAKFISCDISSDELSKLGMDYDYIVHCAALSAAFGPYEDFKKANVIGTKRIVEFAKFNKGLKRFIHISTPSIYFSGDSRINVKESDTIAEKFLNSYASTKNDAENIVGESNLSWLMLRPRAIFGEFDTSIVPQLINANSGGVMPIINGAQCELDLTYVKNVAYAIYLTMNCDDKYVGEVYNVTNDENWKLINILDRLFEGIEMQKNYKNIPYKVALVAGIVSEFIYSKFLKGKTPKLTKYIVSVLSKTQTLDVSKIKCELGYKPLYTVEEGIQRYIKWYKEEQGDGA